MTQQSTEVQIALLIARQSALQAKLDDVEERAEKELAVVYGKLNALQSERDSALKWGVLTLGSAVVSMVVWISNKIIGGQIH